MMKEKSTYQELECQIAELQKQNELLQSAKNSDENIRKELKKKEQFFKGVIENALDIIMTVSKTGTFKYVSPSVETILGYKPDELIGENIFKYVHMADIPRAIIDFSKAILTNKVPDTNAFNILHKDGSTRLLEGVGNNQFNNLAISGFIMNIHDVTSRNQAEAELILVKEEAEASENRFRAMIEASPDGTVITSLEAKVQYVSPKVVTMWGYPHESVMLGKQMTDFLRNDYHEKAAQLIGSMFSGNFTGAAEYVMVRKDGSEFFGEANANILYNEKNKPVSIIIALRDITNRKNAELEIIKQKEQLQEANATKDKFFSIIAHDLKSPFNSMLGFSDILTENFEAYDTEKQKKFIGIINQELQGTYKLLENLLYWSRSQRGTIDFKPENINVHEFVNETSELLIHLAEKKSIHLINQIPEHIKVDADRDLLSIIMRNLISNAIKFTPKYGEISINALLTKEQGFVEIGVTDNGVGISKELQTKLFDLGESTSTKGTENESGTGLGLILCKEFVEKHQGEIWVESEVGKGAIFSFSIPTELNKTNHRSLV